MKLLVVIGNKRSHYRFVAPIISALNNRLKEMTTVIIAPDANEVYDWQKIANCEYQEPVRPAYFTRKVGDLRSSLAFFYWAFLNVQSETVLESKSEKYLSPLARFSSLLKPQTIWKAIRILHRLRLNRHIARFVLAFFRFLELLNPPDRNILSQVKKMKPDMILATPAIYPLSYEMDYVRAGLGLKIPTVILIASWDNLTSKGLLSIIPDRILVWNDVQIQEAKEYHSIANSFVVSIGAPVFDRLFEFEPQVLLPKSDFFARANLDPNRPYVLWGGSSRIACDDESVITRRFVEELRKYPETEKLQVLIRPHPNDSVTWKDWDVEDAPVWHGSDFPNSDDGMKDFYNSIINAVAVVGLSTTLFIETAILDRPCALIKSSEADKSVLYNKYIHFNHLLKSGFPVATENEADCARWVAEIVLGNDTGRQARSQFVNSFLRPHGINRPAAEVAADRLLELI